MTTQTHLKSSSPLLLSAIAASVLWLATSHSIAGEICITAESDPDGDGYGWEQEASCLVTEQSDQIPVIVDPRTGEERKIQRLTWVVADFADKSIEDCHGYLVDPDKETDECLSCASEEKVEYQHLADGNGRMEYKFGEIKFEADFTWGIDDNGFYYGPLSIGGYAEVDESGIKQWLAGEEGKIGFYQQCEDLIPSTMMVTDVKPDVVPVTSTEIN